LLAIINILKTTTVVITTVTEKHCSWQDQDLVGNRDMIRALPPSKCGSLGVEATNFFHLYKSRYFKSAIGKTTADERFLYILSGKNLKIQIHVSCKKIAHCNRQQVTPIAWSAQTAKITQK
jgi:hypothetical protein